MSPVSFVNDDAIAKMDSRIMRYNGLASLDQNQYTDDLYAKQDV